MASTVEHLLSRSLRAVLADLPANGDIGESENLQLALSALTRFIPEMLAEVFPEWGRESLDGIVPVIVRKTKDDEVELFGLCNFSKDQALAPVHLRIRVSPLKDEVCWFEFRVGERGERGMIRTPYYRLRTEHNRLSRMSAKAQTIDWVYKATFGELRS